MPDELIPRVGAEVHHAPTSGDPHLIGGLASPEWSYRQHRRGNADRLYVGRVHRISGAEGERLRSDLAASVAELLIWAAEQQREQGDGAT